MTLKNVLKCTFYLNLKTLFRNGLDLSAIVILQTFEKAKRFGDFILRLFCLGLRLMIAGQEPNLFFTLQAEPNYFKSTQAAVAL